MNDLQASYCEDYFKDPENNWNKQILVINFIIASSVESYSFTRGATKINITEDTLSKYCEAIIVPELEVEKATAHPILTSQCIKFLIIYRNMIPQDWIIDILKKLGSFLTHESVVIRIYSACAVEKFLSMKNIDTKQLLFTKEAINPLLEDLLKQLNLLLRESDGLNIYALISLFRLVTIAKEDFLPYAKGFSEAIAMFVDKCTKDSATSAYSIYVLFETIGYVISSSYKMSLEHPQSNCENIKSYEEALLPVLNGILTENRTDIIIYVFQIYAAFVLYSSSSELAQSYAQVARSVLEDPSNTDLDMKYLVPAYVKLLSAILYRHTGFFADYKEHLFGLLDKILTTLNLEDDATSLLACMTEVLPIDSISNELISATKAIFQRMLAYKSKTRMKKIPDSFLKSVFIFMSRFVLSNSCDHLFNL